MTKLPMSKPLECVLSTGRFAYVRPIFAIDLLLSQKQTFPEAMLMSQIVKLDDNKISYQEALALPAAEFVEIMNLVSKFLPK